MHVSYQMQNGRPELPGPPVNWHNQRRRNVLKSDTAHIVFLVDTAS